MPDGERREALAEEVYRAYRTLPDLPAGRVDPEKLARELLGLRILRRRLSRDGSLLGLTAPAPVGVPIWDEAGNRRWCFLDGHTILLDTSLFAPCASPGRRNFTLMHEVSHRLLDRTDLRNPRSRYCLSREADGREEREADALAAALLMPRSLLAERLGEFGLPLPRQRLDPLLDPETWSRVTALARSLGVSRRALAIRLEGLGLLPASRSGPCASLSLIPMDEHDYAALEENPCRNTTCANRTRSATPGPRRSRASCGSSASASIPWPASAPSATTRWRSSTGEPTRPAV